MIFGQGKESFRKIAHGTAAKIFPQVNPLLFCLIVGHQTPSYDLPKWEKIHAWAQKRWPKKPGP